ncbi:MAG: penicillin-binding protein 1C [Chthoniobacter sp.]|nr:penicillin-binding protein 1C [Chthoniobacter sp.]
MTKSRWPRRLRRTAWVFGGGGVAIFVALRLTPLPPALESTLPASAEFVDRNGQPLRLMLVDERRYSQRCTLAEMSPAIIAATLSAEDKRFRQHRGVDLLATGRALRNAVLRVPPASGASTISQQLIKLAVPAPRTVGSKLAEIWLALCLEQRWSKDRILTDYLNRLEYGNLQTGIAAASRHYFGKPPSDLSAAEAAFLAALPRAPGRLNPRADFAAARDRQQWVLRRMAANGALDSEALARAAAEPLKLRAVGRDFAAPHFVDLLLQRRGLIAPGGGEIRTTLDLRLNQFIEQCLAENLAKIADKNAGSGAAVVLDNATGDVLALAVSGDYFQAGDGQINAAWMVRSPGSAVKPFTYLLALEHGAEPATIVPDVPTSFATPDGLYRPNNYNHRFYGPVSLRAALGNSLNVAAIRTLELAGGPETLHRALRQCGITTLDHPAEYYGLGLTLGNGEVRLLELASAYATLARLGMYRPFRLLLRESGARDPGRRVFDPRAAFLLADMLSDNSARAASFGLDSYLAFDFPVACKTGTSSDYRDNWTVGYTPEFTVAVWVGNPDGKPMSGITGVTGAAPVHHEIFEHLHRTAGTTWFAPPPDIRSYAVHPLTGRQFSPDHPGAVLEKFLRPPELERASDYDATGAVRLPPEYFPWLASPQNNLGTLVSASQEQPTLRILQPPPGATYFLDPDLPAQSQWIPLRAASAGTIAWSSESLPIEGNRAQLRAGRHVITATAGPDAPPMTTWIEVKGL